MPDTLYLIDYAEASGPFNMGLDSALLQSPPDKPVLRLYGWEPAAVSLGRFQKLPPAESRALAPFSLTRRASGGGAIFHWGELTYSICGSFAALRMTGDPGAAYARFHRAWMAALTEFAGLARDALWMPAQRGQPERNEGGERLWCFSRRTGYDVLVERETGDGRRETGAELTDSTTEFMRMARQFLPEGEPVERKIIGSAQRQRSGVLLQHGSIKLKPSPLAPWETGLAEIGGTNAIDSIAVTDAAPVLAKLFAAHLGYRLVTWRPTPSHVDEAWRLAQTRFGDAAWVASGRRKA